MSVLRTILAIGAVSCAISATPAAAQFFIQSRDFSGAPIRGDEPGIVELLPGATDDELRASLVWHLRSGINVAALQCQFAPGLLAERNYTSALVDHQAEMKKSFETLAKYFTRTAKTRKEGQTAFDQFGTRVYASYTTAQAQYGFCQTAASIGRDVLFRPRGKFYEVAQLRLRELRNSLVPYGEQRFGRSIGFDRRISVPRLNALCWTKRDEWNVKKCGPDIQWVKI